MDTAERFRLLHAFLTRNRSQPMAKSPPTFETLSKAFEKDLHFPQSMKDAFATMIAVSLSSTVPADPLWLHVVGPPSSGKSTLCEAIGHDAKHTILQSKLTGLLSGCDPDDGRRRRKDDDDDDATPEDLSPLLRYLGKTLVIKDFTSIMQMGDATLNNLFGELRDCYDGRISASYRNKLGNKDYSDVRFSIITGVTDAIHLLDNTELGERFLKIEILEHGETLGDDLLDKAIANTFASMGSDAGKTSSHNIVMHALREKTAEFLIHKRKSLSSTTLGKIDVPKQFRNMIASVSRLCAIVRTKVQRERGGGDILVRPRAESPARLSGQLTKLSVMLAYTLGKTRTDDKDIQRIIRKVAIDTCRGYPLDIITALCKSSEPLTTHEIATRINISPVSAFRRLNDLRELGAVKAKPVSINDQRGPKSNCWHLTDQVAEYCKAAELAQDTRPCLGSQRTIARRAVARKSITAARRGSRGRR